MWLGHHIGGGTHDVAMNNHLGVVITDQDAGSVPHVHMLVAADDFAHLDQVCDAIATLYKRSVNVGLVLSDKRHPALLVAWLIARMIGVVDALDIEEIMLVNYGLELDGDERTKLGDALAIRKNHSSFVQGGADQREARRLAASRSGEDG